MRTRVRSIISGLAMAWIIALIAWATAGAMRHAVRAESVSSSHWRRAVEQPADLPIRWTPGAGPAPLLPVRGQVLERDGETFIDGLALVPGTFRLERLAFAVEFLPTVFHRYPKLGRPLLPWGRAAKQDLVSGAQAVEICWAIGDPTSAGTEGLRLRWDGKVAVFRGGEETPLFPAREARFERGAGGIQGIGVAFDGNHVRAYVNGQLVFDFYTNRPPTGGVGFGTREGVVTLKKLDVFVPE